MATRQQREHEWPAASVLPQRQTGGRLFAGRLEQGRRATERSTPSDLAIYEPCRETGGNVGCCADRLNPPLEAPAKWAPWSATGSGATGIRALPRSALVTKESSAPTAHCVRRGRVCRGNHGLRLRAMGAV